MEVSHHHPVRPRLATLGCLLLSLLLLSSCRIHLEPVAVAAELSGMQAARVGAVLGTRVVDTRSAAYLPVAMAGAQVGIVHRFALAQVFSAPELPPESIPDLFAEPLDLKFAGIDFAPGSPRITLRIDPPGKKVNQGQEITITFLPGSRCYFGDGQACVNSYRAENGQPVIYLTVHSGVGGQGQAYRHALEGTGLNRAAYSLDQVQKNLGFLQGARVTIQQGETTHKGLVLAGAARVPGAGVLDYFSLPVEHGLSAAAAYQPDLEAFARPEQPLLVFETCGWRMPEEAWSPGTSTTSASVYLGVIHAAP
jgi:hypothetical protein